MNKRIYVTKKPGFQVECEALHHELCQNLGLDLPTMRRYVIYDVFDADEQDVLVLKQEVLAEVNTDEVLEHVDLSTSYLAFEPLSGQYDQRSDSASQCLRLIRPNTSCSLTSGTLLVFDRALSTNEYDQVAHYLINPLESQRKDLSIQTMDHQVQIEPVLTLVGFRTHSQEALLDFQKQESLAMHLDDLVHIQDYFKKEGRDPLYSEIKVLDTYWSDHCRHTTFETRLVDIAVHEGNLKQRIDAALSSYVAMRKSVQRDTRKMSLMDMASIVARVQKANATLTHVEESEEVNACSVEFEIEVDGKVETWLVMYKNETHNHPTEIEPFGGASTCIGGAIRDPLSGRAYVYQAMRISGAADITQPISQTLPNKLPQRLISKGAAAGYSSYGNQIGLATTFVKELYDPGYMAKRMEVGAVVGAVKKEHVLRARCAAKDWVVLLGGPTGRDGIGGATGSSMQHDATSLQTCGAQVQKGNAIIERKLQRLFRNPDVTKRIKKANDFGAGGVSVAIGELAEGIVVDLDAIDVKYNGLNGMEIAISESQERMAIVIDPIHFDAIAAHCEAENLVARKVGEVTDNHRLQMFYQGQCVVDLCRDFIETHGVEQQQRVEIETHIAHHPFVEPVKGDTLEEQAKHVLRSLNVASQQGMVELFDASIGRSTVLNPYGGLHRLSEAMASVQKLPVEGNSEACSILTYGFIPHIAKANPYLGASYGVVEAMARLVSVGGSLSKATISCQEYFESLKQDPLKWGKVSAAMLG
ncbi:MAG: AIR synthase-related protein, partial [Erysipelotrichaceae bacterium]